MARKLLSTWAEAHRNKGRSHLVQDAAIMKNLPVLIVCLALAGGITSPVHSLQETTPSSMAVRDVVEEFKQVYSTDIILGKPLEVDHLKIIPLATVGIGYGQRGVSEDRNATRGAGGIVSPVG